MKKIYLLLTVCFLFFQQANSQDISIKGKVKDASGSSPLVNASIVVKGTQKGTSTDLEGSFNFLVDELPTTLSISYVGYQTKEVQVENEDFLEIMLSSWTELSEVTVVGSRFVPRTSITSPVPIDNISAEELTLSGRITMDKMLMYKVPSFNSTQQTISDATAHFDPADLRGLGPSRTLVLINGKRKNPSSLVFINDTPGKGEVGVDMKSIPAAAIKRIEVLRDGASAMYGSDAIAGVINVILKDSYDYTDINLFSGGALEGDGFNIGYDINTGFKVGKGGFLNISTSFLDQKETNRAGEPGRDDLLGVGSDNAWIQNNPSLGMRVGLPNMTMADVFFNGSVPIAEGKAEFYGFGGLTVRKGKSYALYRTPYWVPDPFNLIHSEGSNYEGFQPTFETDILDNTLAFGVRGEKNNWKYDVSASLGGNKVDYTVNNSINPDMGAESPTSFRPGGYEFKHVVTNIDIAKTFFDKLTWSFGTEFRNENFIANSGEEASYIGGGTQSFPGIQPRNEVNAFRYNIGAYTDIVFDITDDFLLGAAARFENYSDFGNNFTWKANARYKFLEDKLSLRASASTGFRAPSLHQRYLSIIQTLVSGNSVSNQGTFNNENPAIRALEVPSLKEENSFNFTAGVAVKPTSSLYFSLDYYNIVVDDRVVYSSSIATDDVDTPVGRVLDRYSVTSLKFFANAVNTKTSGVDFVGSYDADLGTGSLSVSLAANFNKTEIDGAVDTPAPIRATGIEIFDRLEQSRLETARPNSKIILGLAYEIGKFKAVINNTRFGEVTWRHPAQVIRAPENGFNAGTVIDGDQTFSAKIITDLNLHYRFSDTIGLGLYVNNLLDIYPDEIDTKGDALTNLGGRFKYPWEVNQFGFNGTMIQGKLNIRF